VSLSSPLEVSWASVAHLKTLEMSPTRLNPDSCCAGPLGRPHCTCSHYTADRRTEGDSHHHMERSVNG